MVEMKEMKAAAAKAFGDIDEVLSVRSHPLPCLPRGKKKMLIRVHACSLSPGDWRMLSGDCDAVKYPPSWPYIPSLDVSGVVEEVDEGETEFKKGDEVISTWNVLGMGGMAEYALVDRALTALRPAAVSPVEGAALANSASHALQGVRGNVKAGDRVLVLGGSGGVGTCVVQLAKHFGASFVAATSTQEDLVKELGADVVINYQLKNWWSPEVVDQSFEGKPFDVIFDCAEGYQAWQRLNGRLLKKGWSGGRYVTYVAHTWHISMKHKWQMLPFLVPTAWRAAWSRVCSPLVARYSMCLNSPTGQSLREVIAMVESKQLKIVLDPGSPFSFTTEGVREAFHVLVSRHAHGKVVVSISEDADKAD